MAQSIFKIETENAPKAVGPYSQAVSIHPSDARMVYVSGQLPLDATGSLIQGDIEAATRQALDNIEAILIAAGSSLEQVVRVEVFLKDLNDFQSMNAEYKRRFTGPCLPARQTVQAAKLPMDAPIEISCIAAASMHPA